MNKITKAEATEKLFAGPCTVNFTKVDGTNRVMQASLSHLFLPQIAVLKKVTEKKPPAENDNVVPCYDLEAKGWRSFRLDNLISINLVSLNAVAVASVDQPHAGTPPGSDSSIAVLLNE